MGLCLTSKVVKTRKPHRCYGCYQLQPVGSLLRYESGTIDGGMWSSYMCPVCQEIWEDMHKQDPFAYESISEGDLFEAKEDWLFVQAKQDADAAKRESKS